MTLPFKILDIDHVVLRASDPARLEAFYTDVLGCPLDRRQERISLTQLRAGRAQIDIVPRHDGSADGDPVPGPSQDRNMQHFCLRIDPFNPDAIRRHLDAHGVAYGEVTSRYGADGHGPSIYVTDPEGNEVELKGPPDGSRT